MLKHASQCQHCSILHFHSMRPTASRWFFQVQRLQLLLHKHWPAEQFPDLAELALANCGTVQKRDALAKATASLDVEQLRLLVCRQLGCNIAIFLNGPFSAVCGLPG